MIDVKYYDDIRESIDLIKGPDSLSDFVNRVNEICELEDEDKLVLKDNVLIMDKLEFKGKQGLSKYLSESENVIPKHFYKSIRKLLYMNNLETIMKEVEKLTGKTIIRYPDNAYRFSFVHIKDLSDLKKELVDLSELKLELRHPASHIEFSEDGDYAVLDGVALVYLTEDSMRSSRVANRLVNGILNSNEFLRERYVNRNIGYNGYPNQGYGNYGRYGMNDNYGSYGGYGNYSSYGYRSSRDYNYRLGSNPIENNYACVGQLKRNKKDIEWLHVNQSMYVSVATTKGVSISLLYTMADARDYNIYRHSVTHPLAKTKPYPIAILEDGTYAYSFKPLKGGIIGDYRKYRQRKKASKGLQSGSSNSTRGGLFSRKSSGFGRNNQRENDVHSSFRRY